MSQNKCAIDVGWPDNPNLRVHSVIGVDTKSGMRVELSIFAIKGVTEMSKLTGEQRVQARDFASHIHVVVPHTLSDAAIILMADALLEAEAELCEAKISSPTED